MEPIRLDLENFLSYRRESVDLSPVTCGALVGENGAGKSSLLDAITWALFGQGTKGGVRDLDNYVTRGEKESKVELQFKLNGSTYRVVRGRSVARNKSTLEFFVMDGDRWRPLSGKTIAETQAVIESTLRMDYRTFTASSLILQGQADAFTANMTDQERKEALARILGLDLWDRMQEAAREKVRALKTEIGSLEQQAARLKVQADEYQAHLERYEETKAALEMHSRLLGKLEPEIADLEARLRQRPALLERLSALQRDHSKKTQEIEWTNGEIAKASRQIEMARAEIASKQTLLGMREEIESAVTMEAEFAEEVASFDRQAQEYMRLQQVAADLERKAAAWDKNTETEIARIEARIAAVSSQAATLDKVPCVSDMKEACPLLAGARKAAAELGDLQARLAQLNSAKNPHVDAWQNAVRERDALGYDSDAHEAARKALEDVRRTSRLKADLDAAAKRVEELQMRIADLEATIATLRDKVNALAAEQVALGEQRVDVEAELKALAPAQDELARKQAELQTLRRDEAEIRTELGRLEQQMAGAQEAQHELGTTEAHIRSAREELTVFEVLDQACGKKAGVPALIVENAVPEIERLANDMLGKMAGGRLAVRLDTQVEGKSTGTMQEVLRITVLDGGLERPYQTYSGAERFMVDLALRVALSKFLAHRAGAEIRLFVLDEGLGACDQGNRHAVMNAIQAVAQEFGKTLVITHIAELQDALPQRIEVTKGPEGSKVKVA
ncbi:MAG: AAA family ATPase [Betaproteobacteria bacterium]